MTIPPTPRHDQLAVAAFVCALLIPPLGVALGIVARGEADGAGRPASGLATAAITVGVVGSVLIAISILFAVGAVALLVFGYLGLVSDFG